MATPIQIIASLDIPDNTAEIPETYLFTAIKNMIYRIYGAIIAPGATENARITAMLTQTFTEDSIAWIMGSRRDVSQVLLISPIDGDVYLWVNSPDYTQFNKYRIKVLVEEIKI